MHRNERHQMNFSVPIPIEINTGAGTLNSN